jgi:hypothetical protein
MNINNIINLEKILFIYYPIVAGPWAGRAPGIPSEESVTIVSSSSYVGLFPSILPGALRIVDTDGK